MAFFMKQDANIFFFFEFRDFAVEQVKLDLNFE